MCDSENYELDEEYDEYDTTKNNKTTDAPNKPTDAPNKLLDGSKTKSGVDFASMTKRILNLPPDQMQQAINRMSQHLGVDESKFASTFNMMTGNRRLTTRERLRKKLENKKK